MGEVVDGEDVIDDEDGTGATITRPDEVLVGVGI